MLKKEETDVKVKREQISDNDSNQNSDEEDDQNWWEQENLQISKKGEKRWDTLVHNGVLFPPEYVPHGIPILYEGKTFVMTPEEEEVATMFAVMRETDYYRNRLFRNNFFRSWRAILDKRRKRGEMHPIKELELCDFEAIYKWHMAEREKKLSRTKEEKKKIKEEADKDAEPFKFCLWDGRREQVANFRVEPPGLFRGRGTHPKMGELKDRVYPEDVTVNIGEGTPIPACPPGHRWKEVVHDHNVTWLAMWRDNILRNHKYVMLAPSSTIKGQSDMMKFEKARKLKDLIDSIRASYTSDFESRDPAVAQRAVTMYFIDRLALRVGNEKGSDEADTVGCCSLRVEHIQLLPNHRVGFDFLGKDSIRYQNEVDVLPRVHELLARFVKGKRPSEDVFDQVQPAVLNDHLKSFMDGLSAKVFRTYNASITLDHWFKEKPVDPKASIPDKLAYFNKANTEVAILCNHQKSVSKNFKTQIFQLSAKSQYTAAIIAGLEKAKAALKTQPVEKVVQDFFAEQDRIQNEWLEAYGTEEQRKEYAELVARRKTSGTVTKKKSSSSSSKLKKAAKAKSAKKGKPAHAKKAKKEKKVKKEEPSSDDDDGATLSDLASKPKKNDKKAKSSAKRGRDSGASTKKKPAKKAKKEESDDEDDVPLFAL
ncbi:DNA topoisomerase I [Strigomonas culicis]|uniref:DNA topoisomerase I n=1 Tax=Strigomonas culicis TaxID=28005 RepID=S9UIA7_9TRYP|nr:DNA topoisomerase I [Strigomonas culicis]|eukprot:EPY28663.1 DNA topoisomerase I [Strigomonas culicis]